MRTEKKRLVWAELAQVFSMLLVVFHHSTPNYTDVPGALAAFAGSVHLPALAVFFLCSGYFAAGWEKTSYGRYLGRRAARLLIPWVAVSLLMLLPKALLSAPQARSEMLSPLNLLLSFADPHGRGICPHLWFLPTLFLLSLTVVLLRYVARSRIASVLVPAALFALTVPDLPVPTLFCLNEVRLYLFWFVLGYVLGARRLFASCGRAVGIGSSVCAVLFGAASVLLILYGRSLPVFRALVTVSGAVAILAASVALERPLERFTAFFRGKTFLIYLLSLCAQNFVEVLANRLGVPGSAAFALLFVTGLAVPLAIEAVLRAITVVTKKPLPAFVRYALGL